MNKVGRAVIVGVAAAAGVVAAIGVAAGNDKVKGCINTVTGTLREAGELGSCVRGEVAVDIDPSKSRGGTLTINGIPFKGRRNNTITINGVPFKGRRPKTLTINGVPFKRSGGGTLTINGIPFKKGKGNTLTINGTEFGPGPAAKEGPPGPPGPAPAGGAPVEEPGPRSATTGAGPVDLASASFSNSDGKPHRLLVAGGFSADCATCTGTAQSRWTLALSDGSSHLVTRRLPVLGPGDVETGVAVSEIVVMPSACGPCTLTLRLTATAGGSGGATQRVDATDIRLGIVDLGS